MTEALQFIFQIIQWVVLIFGLIAGIILIIRFFKERPILRVSFNLYHYTSTLDHIIYLINIGGRITINNVGEKDTTINNIEVEVKHDGVIHSDTITFDSFKMPSNDTIGCDVNTHFDAAKEYEKLNMLFTIHHTHGKKSFKTTSELTRGHDGC